MITVRVGTATGWESLPGQVSYFTHGHLLAVSLKIAIMSQMLYVIFAKFSATY